MKRSIIVFLLFAVTCACFSQTQQGIVKTRGRMVNGQLVPGTRLPDAIITLNIGNSLKSGMQGTFSFNVPTGKTYSLVAAKKQGYTLADPEYTQRTFVYSATVPFYVVLEDENQRLADINAATRKVRNTLYQQLEKREQELQELRAKNQLSEKEYQQKLKELNDNQSKSEQLVREMAERYASTDYDQLDDYNRQVQKYIEEGELQKADSMIRTKGDMEKRVAEYRRVVSANQKVRAELEQSEAGATKTYEDLSQDLYRRHEIFLQGYKWDSALYCLKTRADLDTTNIVAVLEYAQLCLKQRKFVDCIKYNHICLRQYSQNNDIHNIAITQNNIGLGYLDIGDYSNSEKYLKSALENRMDLFQKDSGDYRAELAHTQNNIGIMYMYLRDYKNSEKYFKLALEHREKLFRADSDVYREVLAQTQMNLGILYRQLYDYDNSMKYYKFALENKEQLFNSDPDAYRASLALLQQNIGILYCGLRDFSNAEKYEKLSLSSFEYLYKVNPGAYRGSLAIAQKNLGRLYIDISDYSSGEQYFKLALENFENLFQNNPDVESYCKELSDVQVNLGCLYSQLHDYANSERYFNLALENKERLFKTKPDVHRVGLALSYWNVMLLYERMNDWDKFDLAIENALELYGVLYSSKPDKYLKDIIELQNRIVLRMLSKGNVDEALALAKETLAMDESSEMSKKALAQCYNSKAYALANEKQFPKALESMDQAISLIPTSVNLYDSKGEILLVQGKPQEALEMWNKVLELNPDFLKDKPDGTELSKGLKKLGLIE